MVSFRVPRVSYTHEEGFTGTWAYDQVWASLRSYGIEQAGGKDGFNEVFSFRQTGPEHRFPNGFEFSLRDGKPVFALIMRHYGSKGQKADRMVRSEIKTFFEHGVQVVWEVDVDKGCSISVHRVTEPDRVVVYRMGDIAEAEPALPGWRMAVSELSYYRDDGILGVTALIDPDVAIDELRAIPGKAEIVRGSIVHFAQSGGLPGWAADQIFSSLHEYTQRTGSGIAVGDNKAFIVDLPGRKSFSPSAALYKGKIGVGFYNGAPAFAVEVQNGLDYSNDAYGRISAKIKDYFAAGTEVVWVVDVLVYDHVRVYRRATPDESTVYRRGELAEAEPAVPGWTISVDQLFYTDFDNVSE